MGDLQQQQQQKPRGDSAGDGPASTSAQGDSNSETKASAPEKGVKHLLDESDSDLSPPQITQTLRLPTMMTPVAIMVGHQENRRRFVDRHLDGRRNEDGRRRKRSSLNG